MEELIALIALSRITSIPNDSKKTLAEMPGGAASLFAKSPRIGDPAVREALRAFDGFDEIERDLARLQKLKARAITLGEPEYPPLLAAIPDPPLAIYVKGSLRAHENAFAVVGSRKATYEGMSLTEQMAETLSSLGVTVVSGLARGIDASAHRGALKGAGKTIAVLGCGLDIVYPAEHLALFERIAADGLIVTEYRPGTPPLKHHFPERNRIIAGLSRGVVVVEAAAKSGALITARLALEYGREVMAVPGRVFDDQYKGANRLIKQGARLVESMEDILACFPGLSRKFEPKVVMDDEEMYIYALFGADKLHVDELIEKSRMEAGRVMAMLTRLEMKDAIRPIPGGFYMRKG